MSSSHEMTNIAGATHSTQETEPYRDIPIKITGKRSTKPTKMVMAQSSEVFNSMNDRVRNCKKEPVQ